MKLISCEFNMDSGCVEMRFDDGMALDIDCTVVESEYAHTIRQKEELDWLIYNAPLEYPLVLFIPVFTRGLLFFEMKSYIMHMKIFRK